MDKALSSATEIIAAFYSGCLHGLTACKDRPLHDNPVLNSSWKYGFQVGVNISFGKERLN